MNRPDGPRHGGRNAVCPDFQAAYVKRKVEGNLEKIEERARDSVVMRERSRHERTLHFDRCESHDKNRRPSSTPAVAEQSK